MGNDILYRCIVKISQRLTVVHSSMSFIGCVFAYPIEEAGNSSENIRVSQSAGIAKGNDTDLSSGDD